MATSDTVQLLGDVGRHLLEAGQAGARLPSARLGRRVGLTGTAAAERLRRMEEAGLILGDHAAVDPGRLGLPTTVYVCRLGRPIARPAPRGHFSAAIVLPSAVDHRPVAPPRAPSPAAPQAG